jgi:hypothetical protein
MGKGEGHGLIEQILAGTVAHERAALKGEATRVEGKARRAGVAASR